ncbi:MAG: ATP synthase F0 subunit B [Acidobacteriaceae bacterium]
MKKILSRSALAALTLAVVLGVSLRMHEVCVRAARAAGTVSPPEARAGATDSKTAEKSQQEQDENDAYRHSPMVRKLGGMMGLDAEQSATAFEVANFLLLATLVGWGLVKLLPKRIRARNSAIQKDLVNARTASEEAGMRLDRVEERLSKLDSDIAAMRTQAEREWAKEEQRIRASVETEKKNIVAAAEQEIAAATSHAQRALQQFAAELAIEQAARKLVVSAETDRLLVQSFAQRLTGDESKKGQN